MARRRVAARAAKGAEMTVWKGTISNCTISSSGAMVRIMTDAERIAWLESELRELKVQMMQTNSIAHEALRVATKKGECLKTGDAPEVRKEAKWAQGVINAWDAQPEHDDVIVKCGDDYRRIVINDPNRPKR